MKGEADNKQRMGELKKVTEKEASSECMTGKNRGFFLIIPWRSKSGFSLFSNSIALVPRQSGLVLQGSKSVFSSLCDAKALDPGASQSSL